MITTLLCCVFGEPGVIAGGRNLASALLLAGTASALAAGPAWQEPLDVAFTAHADGSTQRYVLLQPLGGVGRKPVDVLVALHGHGSDRWQFVRQDRDECRGLRDAAARFGMLFVSPDYRASTSWMGPLAEADLQQILAELRRKYSVRRVFVAGGSMGGSSALTFAALHPDQVAGVVALNGTANHVEYTGFQDAIARSFGGTKAEVPDIYRQRSAELQAPRLTMPLAATVGGRDQSVPPDSVRRLCAKLKSQGRCVLLLDRPETGHTTNYADTVAAVDFVVRQADGQTPRLLAPDSGKRLVFDTRAIASAENARLVLGAVAKEPANPLFQADRPWENALNNLYPNVLWDADERIFKLWYKCVLADADAIARMDQPSTVHNVGWYLLYATSQDGLHWEKPALDLHKYAGRSGTNIVARDTPNAGVFKDLHDPDRTRRYKMVYDVGPGELRTRFSPDGVHWGPPSEPLGLGPANGDTHNNAFWDERLGKYLWFSRLYQGQRLVARFESADFLHWTNSGMVLRSTPAEGAASQTYCLPVFRYANLYLGYVMMYHLSQGRTVDCELAWSADSLTWQRVAPGVPFIPRGPKGSSDSECIYAMAGPAIAQADDLLIYYGGSDYPHQGWKRHCLPCLARLPLDHFAGYEPVDAGRPARLVSSPVTLGAEPLCVSADAAGGALRVVVIDRHEKVLAESEAIHRDGTDMPVSWQRGDLAALHGQTVRFRFELTRARLWAYRVGSQ